MCVGVGVCGMYVCAPWVFTPPPDVLMSNGAVARNKSLLFTVMKSVFPKLTESSFWPNWVKHTVHMLISIVSISI